MRLSKKQRSIKVMKNDFKTAVENLLASTTFFKGVVLKISINRSVTKEEKLVLKRHQKKSDNLNELNDIYDNPKTVVTDLSSHVLATRPNESNILAYMQKTYGSKLIDLLFAAVNFIQNLRLRMQCVD